MEEKLENLQNDNDLIKAKVSSIYENLKIYADKKRLEHARPPARISQAPKNDPVDEDEVLIPILVIGKVYFVEYFAEKRKNHNLINLPVNLTCVGGSKILK